jgi:hypothetical protein
MTDEALRVEPSAVAAPPASRMRSHKFLLICLILGTAVVYYFSNPERHSPYDYTLRIAEAMLHGQTGLTKAPPDWLNEMVPYHGHHYSVFPLGAVLCMIPVALLRMAHLAGDFPSAAIVALQGAITVFFFFELASRYGEKLSRRVVLALFPLFATWTWCNLTFGGAWQIALGFALMGQAGALYFIRANRHPLLAGLFFAIAFGNRTEVMLTAPLFLYLLLRPADQTEKAGEQLRLDLQHGKSNMTGRERRWAPKWEALGRITDALRSPAGDAVLFLIVPFVLGVCTLAYNYQRFGSISDFGYARIPGILQEPWYKHGIFSLSAIPGNARAMIWNTWKRIPNYPYLAPNGFGESIFLSCPLLFLLFRPGRRYGDRGLKWCAWIAVVLLTFLLWIHGNTGGWQYSYRYAMVLLPWMFTIMLECGEPKWPWMENALFGISITINAWATYLFLWTRYVRP